MCGYREELCAPIRRRAILGCELDSRWSPRSTCAVTVEASARSRCPDALTLRCSKRHCFTPEMEPHAVAKVARAESSKDAKKRVVITELRMGAERIAPRSRALYTYTDVDAPLTASLTTQAGGLFVSRVPFAR